MSININQTHEKEIIALDAFEAVRLRPQMYISQVSLMDDKIPIIKDNKLIQIDKSWSPGLMHLIIEILENSIDEAKRMKGKMKNIFLSINLDTNEVIIKDEGLGFHNAHKKHQKTKRNVVRTAFEELHAGSNFAETENNLIGTHGVGASVCNILCKSFEVETVNKTHHAHFIWDDFKIIKEKIEKRTNQKLGTSVKFIPSKDVFKDLKWDKDIIETYLIFKQTLINQDKFLKNLKINASFIEDNKETPIILTNKFIPDNVVKVESSLGIIFLWESFTDSCSVSFINGSQCSGVHQKIINDWVNALFNYNLAHHFYETYVSLNVPSNLMKFADQNKTKYAISRIEIEELLESNFRGKLIRILKESNIFSNIEKNIEERLYSENIKTIKKAQKISKRKISDKYSPSTKYKENIFLCEGLSAGGSVKQTRNNERDAVYSLKGKLKNTKKLSDLTSNIEILELINILDLDPSERKKPLYNNVVIACDNDFDGMHIISLIINFFNKWFPNVIEDGHLFMLSTPLVVCDFKNKRKYFYSLEEFNNFVKNNKVTNVNYLKGLGSLSLDDWKYVMGNKALFQIIKDKDSDKYLDVAFGESSQKRKEWLMK